MRAVQPFKIKLLHSYKADTIFIQVLRVLVTTETIKNNISLVERYIALVAHFFIT